nr:PREDICTED: reticulon-like protein B5 isoform X2 [Musa acuminata subsp. malaccensis]
MAEHSEESALTEENQQKPRGHEDSSSLSSGSDAEKPGASPSVKVTPYRLFSRERPVHQVLGSGRTADVMLWRNKKISAGVLSGATAIWALFESPPRIPEVNISEELAIKVALNMRNEMNGASAVLREIALGQDLKKFLAVIAVLWILSTVGSSVNFLTLVYITFMTLLTVPVLYEKYEDKIDASAEKAIARIKQQYAVFDAKVLSMIRRGPLKAKKH